MGDGRAGAVRAAAAGDAHTVLTYAARMLTYAAPMLTYAAPMLTNAVATFG